MANPGHAEEQDTRTRTRVAEARGEREPGHCDASNDHKLRTPGARRALCDPWRPDVLATGVGLLCLLGPLDLVSLLGLLGVLGHLDRSGLLRLLLLRLGPGVLATGGRAEVYASTRDRTEVCAFFVHSEGHPVKLLDPNGLGSTKT